jgi:hypothetical protein
MWDPQRRMEYYKFCDEERSRVLAASWSPDLSGTLGRNPRTVHEAIPKSVTHAEWTYCLWPSLHQTIIEEADLIYRYAGL